MQVKLSYIYTLPIEERPITVPVFHSEDLLNIFTPRGRQPNRPRSVMCLVFSPSKLHRKSLMDYFEPDKNIQGSEWWDSWIPPAHGPLRSLSLISNSIMQLQARLEKKPGTSLALQDHGCVPPASWKEMYSRTRALPLRGLGLDVNLPTSMLLRWFTHFLVIKICRISSVTLRRPEPWAMSFWRDASPANALMRRDARSPTLTHWASDECRRQLSLLDFNQTSKSSSRARSNRPGQPQPSRPLVKGTGRRGSVSEWHGKPVSGLIVTGNWQNGGMAEVNGKMHFARSDGSESSPRMYLVYWLCLVFFLAFQYWLLWGIVTDWTLLVLLTPFETSHAVVRSSLSCTKWALSLFSLKSLKALVLFLLGKLLLSWKWLHVQTHYRFIYQINSQYGRSI